jgi:hypothetical protein
MSFLSEMLPGVSMIAQRSTAVSGAPDASAISGDRRVVIKRIKEVRTK